MALTEMDPQARCAAMLVYGNQVRHPRSFYSILFYHVIQ